jgi:adenine-specific DNA-methyltransferase
MAAHKKNGGTTATGETPIEALIHKETRKNIPTREQGEFVADEEDKPETMLYPRDPTLDPQLVWTGKDEQDCQDLAVPVVPIYIQEKIEPKALIDDLRARAAGRKPQLDLFGAVEGGRDIEEQIEFYQHDDQWTNRMILGDSLVVMTSLAQKEGLKGKVQMIYLDPPYGIKFGSNWQVSTRKREVKDGKVEDLVRQPEQIKAFRDTWELGIHSYLSYMRNRLRVASELLTESGSIFVQIGDDNVHLLRCILDEIFGSSNFVVTIIMKKKGATTPTDPVNDYILWYAKDRSSVRARLLVERRRDPEDDSKFNTLIGSSGEHARVVDLDDSEIQNLLDKGHQYARVNYPIVSQHPSPTRSVDYVWQGKRYGCGQNAQWRFDPGSQMIRLARAGRLFDGGGKSLGGVINWADWPYVGLTNIWNDLHGDQEPMYVVQTNRKATIRCMLMVTDPGDLVLDPTCGSGTTAFVAEQLGRRWITIDTSRVALAIARTRLMSEKFPYYFLKDSIEGARRLAELDGMASTSDAAGGDIRQGFVYKRVAHIALRSIANNEEIDTIHARYQEQLEPLCAKLNKVLKKKWEEWEIPRDADSSWPTEVKAAHAEWWQLRRARQQEIDASIARRAESEILYDQPDEDKKRIRVSGPFTVESLSPHRMLDAGLPQPRSTATADAGSFVTTILDNLKKAGIQNTIKKERLVLDRLNTFAHKWIQAEGEFTDKGGATRRVAISIGPEHGTVSPEQVRGAAKAALKDFDMVVVCGFAFDALAHEAAREFSPKNGSNPPPPAAKGAPAPTKTIPVLLSRMNPDLAMGDELLKKTGAGNLFMVFGEPDIAIHKAKDGKLTVEIKGLDVYDPTTGQIRSHTTDDIACWFLDTDYNGESFFVRHAYFTGANDPYEKLKRALKAEIDEATWASLYTTKSRAFDPPKGGYLAVKVINHYGDEVLKVYKAP